jgi:hypothetical protein
MSYEPGNNPGSWAGFILDTQRDLYTFTAIYFGRHAFSSNASFRFAGRAKDNFHSNQIPFGILICRDDGVAALTFDVHRGTTQCDVLFLDQASARGTAR